MNPGQLFLGRYRIVRKLGSGGMGYVLEAEDQKFQRRVAIKFLLPQFALNDEVVARFQREALAAAQIGSDYTVQVYDDGVYEGAPYMILEFLDGVDLGHFEDARRALPFPVAAALFVQAAKALEAAHRKGIVHRDIKPANLFVSRREDGPRLKLVDFGISKLASSPGLTSGEQTIGTAYFMSPEQLKGAKGVDARADIWALGASLYVALTGRRPFEAQNMGELFGAIWSAAPTPPQTLVPEIPSELNALVLHCLDKNRDTRVQTATELGQRLRAFADEAQLARYPLFDHAAPPAPSPHAATSLLPDVQAARAASGPGTTASKTQMVSAQTQPGEKTKRRSWLAPLLMGLLLLGAVGATGGYFALQKASTPPKKRATQPIASVVETASAVPATPNVAPVLEATSALAATLSSPPPSPSPSASLSASTSGSASVERGPAPTTSTARPQQRPAAGPQQTTSPPILVVPPSPAPTVDCHVTHTCKI